MASISTTGVGSGLDINSIISQLMTAERAPATKRLDTKEATLQAQLSAVGTFKGALADFQSALTGVTGVAKFQNLSATISNDALFSATTTSAAQAGGYSVEIQQLAQAQKLITSDTQRFSAVTDTVGMGTLTFQFGTTASNGTFTENSAKTAKTVTIDATNNTLAGVRDAINKANIGVRANLINDGVGYRLSLASTEAGANNSLKITAAGETGLSRLAYDPGGIKNMKETVAAQNALLTVDGLDITSATNSVVGVVPGVTLNLKSKSTTPATLTIAQDSTVTTKAVSDFVTAYNKLMDTSKSLTAYNAQTGEKGALLGDSSARSIIGRIRSLLTSSVTGAAGSLHSLADAGVSLQRDGTLSLNSSKLETALGDDPQAVASLFSRVGRTSDPLISYSSAASASKAGSYAISVSQIATQAQYIGTAPTGITVGADNDSFQIKINGTDSGTISLTQKTYATGADLATELQTQINADSALSGAGVSVSVSYDADNRRLMFASNGGPDPSVEFTAVDTQTAATLGFNVGGGSPTYTAATPSAITIGADNNSFTLTVNGKAASAAITLTEGSYTGAELATALQSRINADSGLASVGAALTVSYQSSSNQFSFTSSNASTYGNASSIQFTSTSSSVQATLGISTNRVAGQNIAGTIGGVDAIGAGRKLTGAGTAAGITLEVLGGSTGSRGTLSLSDGIAQQLDSLIDNFLGSDGPLSSRTESINKQIAQIGTQRTALNTRMDALEANYRTRFMAMDTLVSSLNATSTYLTQQFNNNSSNSN
ncbi:MAG: flagellar filament capping protein FliD [Candidatus Contendobacter sp.]|nr:flagellar filament capping protein FliD [Candidatus Contendobacter sp.]